MLYFVTRIEPKTKNTLAIKIKLKISTNCQNKPEQKLPIARRYQMPGAQLTGSNPVFFSEISTVDKVRGRIQIYLCIKLIENNYFLFFKRKFEYFLVPALMLPGFVAAQVKIRQENWLKTFVT